MHRLLGELAAFLGEPGAYQGDEKALHRHGFGPDRTFHTLLGIHGNRISALANFFPEHSTWRGTPGVYILDLYVSADRRGSGLGRRLLTAVATHAAEQWRARYVRLTVHGHNDPALRFYQRLGFSLMDNDRVMAAPLPLSGGR